MAGEPLRGCFVTGADTGVGKTVLAAAIIAGLRQQGVRVRAFKPVITGLDDPSDPRWPPDHELLARAAGCSPGDVVMFGYGPPVSPHLAAELAGVQPPALAELTAGIRGVAQAGTVAVVEGVGGLLVPLGPGYDVRALARELALPLIIAARPGLGTINHTLLTIEAARAAGLNVAGVVLTPWPADPGAVERSNRETIARLAGVEVAVLDMLPGAEPALLAAAAHSLPLERWLAGSYGEAPAAASSGPPEAISPRRA